MNSATETTPIVLTPEELLKHWQGHRALTRRMIEAFPEDKLFNYSIGGMRPFAKLAMEMLGMAVPTVKGAVTSKWESYSDEVATTKEGLLRQWDDATEKINALWSTIPPHRFQEVDLAFGQYKGTIWWILFYIIDNEIHHRGQGYVYLRSLGIEPPPFWDR